MNCDEDLPIHSPNIKQQKLTPDINNSGFILQPQHPQHGIAWNYLNLKIGACRVAKVTFGQGIMRVSVPDNGVSEAQIKSRQTR